MSDDSQKSKENENTTENIVDSIEQSERPCSLKVLLIDLQKKTNQNSNLTIIIYVYF